MARVTRWGQNPRGGHSLGVRVLGVDVLVHAEPDNQAQADRLADAIAALGPEDQEPAIPRCAVEPVGPQPLARFSVRVVKPREVGGFHCVVDASRRPQS